VGVWALNSFGTNKKAPTAGTAGTFFNTTLLAGAAELYQIKGFSSGFGTGAGAGAGAAGFLAAAFFTAGFFAAGFLAAAFFTAGFFAAGFLAAGFFVVPDAIAIFIVPLYAFDLPANNFGGSTGSPVFICSLPLLLSAA
jgi:hypothetical protein